MPALRDLLTILYHDRPERHRFGRAFDYPEAPVAVGVASKGGSNSPARSDHSHAFQDEAWHYVGSAGEPAFQNGWVNYHNTPATNSWIGTRFKKMNGLVIVQGLIKNGAVGVVFTLPPGYRPLDMGAGGGPDGLLFVSEGNGGLARIDVGRTGTVTVAVGSAVYTTLTGIIFPAEA